MSLSFGLLLGFLVSVAHGGIFSGYNGPIWDDLKVTLGVPGVIPFVGNDFSFNEVPLTIRDAKSNGWTQIGSDCTNDGHYNGYRYVPPDGGIAALYDTKGNVAGIQMLPEKNKILTGKNGTANPYNFAGESMFNVETILGIERFVLTAYVIDPASICTTGGQNVPSGQIGNGLWFQTGPTSDTTSIAPKKRQDAKNQGWNNNHCLVANGYHNFYQSDKWDLDNCASMKPYWLFYNSHEDLMGFGFTVPGYDDSPRYQHPPGTVVGWVLSEDGPSPQCAIEMGDGVGFTNINIYFESQPYFIGC